jgi:hypothetical protein
MDGGQAWEVQITHGAVICHSIHGDALELFPTILSIRPTRMWEVQITHGAVICHSIHGDALELFPTILSIYSIHGDKK